MTREKLQEFINARYSQNAIIWLISFNSIIIGLETSPTVMDKFGPIIDKIDLIILGIFVIELSLKIYAYRWGFFKSYWNLFDASVIIISVLPAAGSFAVFRALRILRTLRLLKNVPKLKLIIESLLHAVPSIGWIMVLLLIIFYVFAVIGTNIFGQNFPEFFGSFGDSMFTLFQIMTLESWSSGIARPILSVNPFATIYFVIFILIATYTTLNIFIAIVVNTMNELHHKDLLRKEEKMQKFVHSEHQELVEKLDRLTEELLDLKKAIKPTEVKEPAA